MKALRGIETGQGTAGNLLGDIAEKPVCFWEVASQVNIATFGASVAAAERKSLTVQAGSTGSTDGSTSSNSKPSNPLLALASEYGGITSSTNAQTITFQGTLDGIPRALVLHGIKPYCWSQNIQISGCVSAGKLSLLNRFGYGITANTAAAANSASGTTVGSPTGNAQQVSLTSASTSSPSLSSVTAKFTIIRGPYQAPKTLPSVKGAASAKIDLLAIVGPDSQAIPKDIKENLQVWRTTCLQKFEDSKFKSLSSSEKDQVFDRYYLQVIGIIFFGASPNCSDEAPIITAVPSLPSPPTPWQESVINAMNDYVGNLSLYEANLTSSVLDNLSAPTLSFEYDFNTPQNQPTNYNLKLVYGQSFHSISCKATEDVKLLATTVNVAANLYTTTPSSSVPSASILRDVQAGMETDLTLCTSNLFGSWYGDSSLGFAYYYQDQTSPSILKVTPGAPISGITLTGLPTTTNLFTSRGPINVAQIKYGWGVGKNVKFPIAFTWSNRTELITHSVFGVQFGLSYDFSSLFGSGGNSSGGASAGAGGGAGSN